MAGKSAFREDAGNAQKFPLPPFRTALLHPKWGGSSRRLTKRLMALGKDGRVYVGEICVRCMASMRILHCTIRGDSPIFKLSDGQTKRSIGSRSLRGKEFGAANSSSHCLSDMMDGTPPPNRPSLQMTPAGSPPPAGVISFHPFAFTDRVALPAGIAGGGVGRCLIGMLQSKRIDEMNELLKFY
jgi:hypothetical protein